jgi:SAM-dependent methyltransferase
MQERSPANERIQYGCGLSAPGGWRNFDASPTLRAQRLPLVGRLLKRVGVQFPDPVEYGDVTRRLPVSDGAARVVYCSHVLEHLSLEGLRAALRESYRILQSGGTFRLVVPDLEVIVDSYRANPGEDAAVQFMRDTILGQEARPASLGARVRDALGNAQHRWMWDYPGLAKELREAGFVDIRRASYGDSLDAAFSEVEEEDRWTGCLGIECRKP